MRSLTLAALALVILSALTLVFTRQENRKLFSALHQLRAERDSLDTEWGQLLLEEGAWSQHQRVETTARQRLGMDLPPAERIVVVRLPETSP
ncbi:MAG: cell division protein FtsL [Pseudomonadota bacterium]